MFGYFFVIVTGTAVAIPFNKRSMDLDVLLLLQQVLLPLKQYTTFCTSIEIDLSTSLKLKSNDTLGLSVYDFLSVFNSEGK